jgi:hypothetical protein
MPLDLGDILYSEVLKLILKLLHCAPAIQLAMPQLHHGIATKAAVALLLNLHV